MLVLICADFWFADVFLRAGALPDLVLVPALSVTRKPTPDYSRTLWRHLAVARAYEFGCYVGISDWGYPSELPVLFASGVAGFADPTLIEPERLFQPVGEAAIRAYPIDFLALDAFRKDREARGFFWKSVESMNDAERLRRVGLCASCRHAKHIVSSKGSEFWLCGRAERDPAFRKYPPLPSCVAPGYEPSDPAGKGSGPGATH